MDRVFASTQVDAWPEQALQLLRPDQDGIGPTTELLEMVLNDYEFESLAGTTVVVTPRGIRVRRAVT